jgi:hypothetical protein
MKQWTKEDSKRLASYKYITDDDNIRIKEIIKQKLLANDDIIHVLDNKELQEADAENDEYFGEFANIRDYYLLPETQSNAQNFICYTVGYENVERNFTNSSRTYNDLQRHLHIIFVVLCEEKNIRDRDTGIARHDLLAALIQNEFNHTNYFGRRIELISDNESVVDSKYLARTLIFSQVTDNNVTKTQYGNPSRFVNKEIHT